MRDTTVTIKVSLSESEYKKIKEHINRRGEKVQFWVRGAILTKYEAQAAQNTKNPRT